MAREGYSYHVFLSFRGPDTREKFTCLLYDALTRAGLVTFMDDEDIRSGEEIDSRIREGIKSSMSAIVVFSENFASSRWCLDELALILERKKTSVFTLLPIYYYGVQPSDIKHHQNNKYGQALEKHKEKYGDRVDMWKSTLEKVGGYKGKIVKGKLNKFLNEIVKDVQKELGVLVSMINPPPPSLNPHLGGIIQLDRLPSVLNPHPGMGQMERYFNAKMPNLALYQSKEDNNIKEPENEDASTSQIKESAIEEPVRMTKSVGPWGGKWGSNLYNYVGKGDISHIYIRHDVDNIKAIWFTSRDKNRRLETSSLIGGENWYYQTSEVVLDTKIREKLVGISGTVGNSVDFTVITSLKFYTSTNRSFGPFGLENGTRFSYMADEGCSIIGFYGRFGGLLDSIGLHVLVNMLNLALCQPKEDNNIKEPENEDASKSQVKESAIEEPLRMTKSVGPWGGKWGSNLYNYVGKGDISHIYIRHEVNNIQAIWFTCRDKNGRLETSSFLIGGENENYQTSEVVLDTNIREKLVGISGTVGNSRDFTVITSLKFYTSTNRSFGPFGLENGTRFSYMADEGCFIIGFYGRFGGLLDSIGLHVLVT